MLSVLRTTISYTAYGCLLISVAAHGATPSTNGQSGYINMPSALVEPDGTFSLGYSYDTPYGSTWASATILPFLQVGGRYVSVNGIPGFSNTPGEFGAEYGRYKDKVVDLKLRLWKEGPFMPALAVGATDVTGTALFKGQYLVATKTFGAARNLEASVGVGRRRPDGMFGGVRWTPQSLPRWSVLAEYDAVDYPRDFRAPETDAGTRRAGPVLGLEYRWGWLGAQVARHRDHFSANLFASIPLSQQEFIPKLFEPRYFAPKTPPVRATYRQWQEDTRHAAPMIAALARQDFKNVRVTLDGATLRLALTNSRISEMGRAVGRASRVALAYAPLGTRSVHITYTRLEQPLATYEFNDLGVLSDYLGGVRDRDALLRTVLVRPATPGDAVDGGGAVVDGLQESTERGLYVGRDGEMLQFRSSDREANRVKIMPRLGFFFNDPSGALRYEVAAVGAFDKRLGNGLYLNSAARLSVFENISGVTQASNSLLPHVRTDIAEYKRGSRFKLSRALLNQYLTPTERVYARLSAGIYEEMYMGAGGQVLYLPGDGRWAADLSVDALRQRDFKGWFGVRDYQTVTALGSLHYKLPFGITGTARAGRFLAKDTGVRVEFKRRFRSGVELGAWYAKTNGNDITSPGTPQNPYNDKGVFLSIPLRSMLTADTQAGAGFALSPWTRDVGQMVASPGDLQSLFEQPTRDLHTGDGLGHFGERADEKRLPALNQPDWNGAAVWPAFRERLEQSYRATPSAGEWLPGAGWATGAVLASALLDKPMDRYVARHADSRLARSWGNFGKNMPVALAATAGTAALLGDARMQNIGLISLQAIGASVGVSALGKYAVQRSRPEAERGSWRRVGEGESRYDSSFPSGHSAVAFAAVTPFAQEYDAPWLYGVAAVSAMGRVANRKHWVSDTVAGGVVGYAVGNLLWKAQRDNTQRRWSVAPGLREVSVSYSGSY